MKKLLLLFIFYVYALNSNDFYEIYELYKKHEFAPYIRIYRNDIKNYSFKVNLLNSYYYNNYFFVQWSKNFSYEQELLKFLLDFVQPNHFELEFLYKKNSIFEVEKFIKESLEKYDFVISYSLKESEMSDWAYLSNFEVVSKNHYRYLDYLIRKKEKQKILVFFSETLSDQIAYNFNLESYIKEINQNLKKKFINSYKRIQKSSYFSDSNKKILTSFMSCLKNLPEKSLQSISLYFFSNFFNDYDISEDRNFEEEKINKIYNEFYKIWYNPKWIELRLKYLSKSCKKIQQKFQ